jgi:hypothetical protein
MASVSASYGAQLNAARVIKVCRSVGTKALGPASAIFLHALLALSMAQQFRNIGPCHDRCQVGKYGQRMSPAQNRQLGVQLRHHSATHCLRHPFPAIQPLVLDRKMQVTSLTCQSLPLRAQSTQQHQQQCVQGANSHRAFLPSGAAAAFRSRSLLCCRADADDRGAAAQTGGCRINQGIVTRCV